MSALTRLACALLVAGVAACGGRDHPPNVIVILVDTLRADRLGAYGSTAKLTPFLDELAARGTVFRHAVAPSPWTNPSVASLFTSLPQARHGVTAFSSVLPADAITLAETLRERGYRTAAFIANGMLGPTQGFDRGFEHYVLYWKKEGDTVVKRRADTITPDVTHWLDQPPATPGQPVFVYLHYMEAHNPYSPPQTSSPSCTPGPSPTWRPPSRPRSSAARIPSRWRRSSASTTPRCEPSIAIFVRSSPSSSAAACWTTPSSC